MIFFSQRRRVLVSGKLKVGLGEANQKSFNSFQFSGHLEPGGLTHIPGSCSCTTCQHPQLNSVSAPREGKCDMIYEIYQVGIFLWFSGGSYVFFFPEHVSVSRLLQRDLPPKNILL